EEILKAISFVDKIVFGKWAGTEIKINGKEFLIMKESDVMGVL
ncbi:MAG: hypothetical protein AABY27_03650, partial [Pseudomonadota bacterium]